MSWERPSNKPAAQRNVNIIEAREESNEEAEENNPPKEGESRMLKRALVKTKKKVHEAA